MHSEGHRSWTRNNAIPEQRDRLQSQLLTWVVGMLLAAAASPLVGLAILTGNNEGRSCRAGLIVSLLFGLIVVLLRAATIPAALLGSIICLLIYVGTELRKGSLIAPGLVPLVLLFLLTFAATRIARRRGVRSEIREIQKGRRASQIVANLGWAGLVASVPFVNLIGVPGYLPGVPLSRSVSFVLLAAVLAEATADTVSSEIGQAFGGEPFLFGSWRRVEPGTDGAVTMVGTAAGCCGALLLILGSAWSLQLSLRQAAVALIAALAGFLADTLLGATAERKGWLGNDLVNFISNGSAALLAYALLLM